METAAAAAAAMGSQEKYHKINCHCISHHISFSITNCGWFSCWFLFKFSCFLFSVRFCFHLNHFHFLFTFSFAHFPVFYELKRSIIVDRLAKMWTQIGTDKRHNEFQMTIYYIICECACVCVCLGAYARRECMVCCCCCVCINAILLVRLKVLWYG